MRAKPRTRNSEMKMNSSEGNFVASDARPLQHLEQIDRQPDFAMNHGVFVKPVHLPVQYMSEYKGLCVPVKKVSGLAFLTMSSLL